MKIRASWPSWVSTAVALLGLMGLAYGQGEPVSGTALVPELLLMERAEPGAAPAAHAVPTSITDDRHQGDQRLEARQLIIALTAEHDQAIPVEVLDERGRRVHRCLLQAQAGRRALALDVSALAQGRYVARIGEAGPIVRFVR
ncbi:MAG: hypothetical protein QM724_00490 [Flavobacteriales bacterium]